MKQCLSYGDLKDFHIKKIERIATKFGQYGNCFSEDGETCNLAKLSERITIGRLIEVINNDFSICMWHEGHKGWVVTPIADWDDRKWIGEDLCTALWNVMKDDI